MTHRRKDRGKIEYGSSILPLFLASAYISPSGDQFVFVERVAGVDVETPPQIILVQNRIAELKARVPVH